MEIDNKSAVFFKEYPCYHFALYPHTELQIQREFHYKFDNSRRALQAKPPAAIVDTHSQRETLYLLQWNATAEHSVQLLVRQLQAKEWIKITMNFYPDFLAISNGSIFVIAAEELLIITPQQLRTDRITLQKDEICSVHPTVYQYQTDSVQPNYEAGVYFLYKSPKGLFYSAEYSSNREHVNKPGLLSKLTGWLQRKTLNYLHVEVIIPSILGLAFLENGQFWIINLKTMAAVENVSADFRVPSGKEAGRPLVRWKKHQMKGYNEAYLILVGVGSYIFSFYLMIKYKADSIKLQLDSEPLTNFLTPDIVDWPGLAIKPYLTFAIEGSQLIDMAISTKGLIYMSKDSESDLIGQCKYLDMNSLLNEYPIISQQCTIWRLYYEDIEGSYKTDSNRLLAPNRYPYDLVRSLEESEQFDPQLSNEIALNLWRNRYAFCNFLTFQQELLIVRSGSLSVFRNIQEELFHREYLTHSQLQKIEAQYLSKYRFQSPESLSQKEEFEDPQLLVNLPRPLVLERTYKSYCQQQQQSEEFLQIKTKTDNFRMICSQLQDIMLQTHQHLYRSLITPQLQYELICRQLKDKISYFSIMLSDNVYFPDQNERQRQYNKLYEKNAFTARVLQYFYGLYLRSAESYRVFGSNFINLFVESQMGKLSDDINASVYIIMQLLLEGLLPKELANQNSSLIYNEICDDYRLFKNPFIDFLITRLKTAHDHKRNQQVQVIRSELSKLVQTGFFNHRSIFFSQIWKNTSLLSAVLLCTSTCLNQSVFIQYLLFNFKAKQLHVIYSQLKKYMQDQTIKVIQKQLYFNVSKHSLKIDTKYLLFEDWIQGSSEENVAIYGKVNRDIVNRQLLHQGALLKQDNLQQINNRFDELLSSSKFDSEVFQSIRQLIKAAVIPNNEEFLEFYEKILALLVRLFNDRVRKDHDLHYYLEHQNSSDLDKELFRNSRRHLASILKAVRNSFEKYIEYYELVYGRDDRTTLQKQNQMEEGLMSQMFMDQPIYLIDHSKGLILSQTALRLLEQALRQGESSERSYSHSLGCLSNLLCFWFMQLPYMPAHEVAYLYKYLRRYDHDNHIGSFMHQQRCDALQRRLSRAASDNNQEGIKNIILQIPQMIKH